MDVAAARTGRAFIVSALTAIAGVAVIRDVFAPAAARLRTDRDVNVASRPERADHFPPMLVWRSAQLGVRGLVPADKLRSPGIAQQPRGRPDTAR